MARKMGTDIVLNPKEVNLQDEVDRITHGAGMDIVVELTGNRGVVNDAAKTLRRGGEMVLVGLYSGPGDRPGEQRHLQGGDGVRGHGKNHVGHLVDGPEHAADGEDGHLPGHHAPVRSGQYDQAFALAESAASGKILFTI